VLKTMRCSRRVTSRAEVNGGLCVFWSCNGRDDLSRVRDLSVGGLFIETRRPKELGAPVKVHFLVSEGQIRADAVVRHVEPGMGLGLRFTALNDQDGQRFEDLVKRLKGLAPSFETHMRNESVADTRD
jgi:PilZ domain